jgi:hypothetical protein
MNYYSYLYYYSHILIISTLYIIIYFLIDDHSFKTFLYNNLFYHFFNYDSSFTGTNQEKLRLIQDNKNLDSQLNITKLLNIKQSEINSFNLHNNKIWTKIMHNNGAIVINDVLSNSDCDSLLKIVSEENNKYNKFTGKIRSNLNRLYFMLPLEKTQPYIKKVYLKLKYFCDNLLPNTKLIESSVFITYPGSLPQRFHIDGGGDIGSPNVFTFGIALDDITKEMGPLEYYLTSHKISDPQIFDQLVEKNNILWEDYYSEDEEFDDPTDGLTYNTYQEVCNKLNLPKKICTCKKGSVVIWSWNGIHRGTGNTQKTRPVFYFSLMGIQDQNIDIDHFFWLVKKNNYTYILGDDVHK